MKENDGGRQIIERTDAYILAPPFPKQRRAVRDKSSLSYLQDDLSKSIILRSMRLKLRLDLRQVNKVTCESAMLQDERQTMGDNK